MGEAGGYKGEGLWGRFSRHRMLTKLRPPPHSLGEERKEEVESEVKESVEGKERQEEYG